MNTISRILEYLESRSPSTVDQISRDLGLTKADIRHHLNALIREKKVEPAAGSYQNGPGRPAAMFSIKIGPNVALMQSILTSFTAGLAQMHLSAREKKRLAAQIAANLIAQVDTAGPPSVRISAMIQYLQPLGFVIHWEATSKGPLIVIKKEPVSAILPDGELAHLVLASLLDLINKKSPG